MPATAKTPLDAAIDGEPWSVSGVLSRLESVCDDEGRPLFEERAPIAVRTAVETVVRVCPYRDERQGRRMNVSALTQILHHMDDVLADVGRFRAQELAGDRSHPRGRSWHPVLEAVMDQLLGPAVYLLDRRQRTGPVPAKVAVGYKLAIGYSVPLRKLVTLQAAGMAPEVSRESLHELVREQKLLVGAREVCAAPMHTVTRVTDTFVDGCEHPQGALPERRLRIARLLALQWSVGIVWSLFDVAAERRLLVELMGAGGALRPRNEYLERSLAERVAELCERPAGHARLELPEELDAPARQRLQDALRTFAQGDGADADAVRVLVGAMGHGGAAVELTDRSVEGSFATAFVGYLAVHRAFVEALRELERSLRQQLGYPLDVPVALHAAAFPPPRCLGWFERISGYRVRAKDDSTTDLMLRNQHRVLALSLQ